MTDRPARDGQNTAHDRSCIADETTTSALNELTRPISRTALSVAVLAVIDALTTVSPHPRRGVCARVRTSTVGDQHGTITVRDDDGASLLTRLVNLQIAPYGETPTTVNITLDPETADDACWSVERAGEPERLVLQRPRSGTDHFTTVRRHAHRTLELLADPTESSRWTEAAVRQGQTGDSGQPLSAEIERRWQRRLDEEAQAATRLLIDWLKLDDLPSDGVPPDEWWNRLGISPALRPLLDAWSRWLRDHDVLASDAGILQTSAVFPDIGSPQQAWSGSVRSLSATLTRHGRLIGRVLAGDAPPTELLTAAELRPARLAADEPDLHAVWTQIGDTLQQLSLTKKSPLTLADVGDVTRDNTILWEKIASVGAQVTALPAGHRATDITFDVVLSVGALHRWSDARNAVRDVSALLRPGGTLIAVENTAMTPLGMLLAGLLEAGFTDSEGNPIDTPVSDTGTWARLLDQSGVDVTCAPIGPTPAVLLHGERRSGEPVDAFPMRHKAALPALETGPIRNGTESAIAAMWSQLIPTPPHARDDSFFELGGDSLLATRFIAALQQRYGIVIPMRDLFADPRLAAVAAGVDAAISESTDQETEEGVL